MAFAAIIDKILAFLKWCWQNKWTILFIATTITLLMMYGCERREVKKLNEQIVVEKAKIAQCEANYNTAISANKEMENGLSVCQKELEITKQSFKEAEAIKSQFEEEIAKFKKLAEDIDKEKDPEKALEKKKKIIEELFKGKNAGQIRSILKTF